MIKTILLDADGIVIQGRNRYFSEILAEEQEIDPELVIKFFKKDYRKCVLGKANLKEELIKYLDEWRWDKSVDELLEHWFSFDGKPSEEVLEIVRLLRDKGIKVYLASDHTKYRADDIMKRMKMENHFDGSFFSCDLGYTKEDVGFYEKIINELRLTPNEIMFWDDEKENVEAAEKAGIEARFYENFKDFKQKLDKILQI